MWQIMFGFVAGVYVGTNYDCKPTIHFVSKFIKDNIPQERVANKND